MFRPSSIGEITESGLALPLYDYVSNSNGSTVDIWTFKIGGSGGSVVCTVTLTYADSTKAALLTVVRDPLFR